MRRDGLWIRICYANPNETFEAVHLSRAIHVAGTQILQLYCRDFVERHGKIAANLLYFSNWTKWMAGTIPAMTALIDSVMNRSSWSVPKQTSIAAPPWPCAAHALRQNDRRR